MQRLLFCMQSGHIWLGHRACDTIRGRVKAPMWFKHDILLLKLLNCCEELFCALQVHHPHAVRFFGACTKRQPYMIVTEYLPGGRWAVTTAMILLGILRSLTALLLFVSGRRITRYVQKALCPCRIQPAMLCSDLLP